jgi:hypothetical protein
MVSVAKNLRWLIAIIIVPVVQFFISNAIHDIVKAVPEARLADRYAWGVIALQVTIGSISYFRLTRPGATIINQADRERAIARLSKWGFGLTITFSLAFASYNQFADVKGIAAAVFAYALPVFLLVTGVVFVIHLARTRPS